MTLQEKINKIFLDAYNNQIGFYKSMLQTRGLSIGFIGRCQSKIWSLESKKRYVKFGHKAL